ncbi:hypothetical protein [Lysinibacillus fusiformis]
MSQAEKRRQSKAKPEGFADMEALVKQIFEAQDQSYFDRLH